MSKDSPAPSERIRDIARMSEALRRAVRLALLEHKRAGNPVAVWRDDRVVWIPASEITIEESET